MWSAKNKLDPFLRPFFNEFKIWDLGSAKQAWNYLLFDEFAPLFSPHLTMTWPSKLFNCDRIMHILHAFNELTLKIHHIKNNIKNFTAFKNLPTKNCWKTWYTEFLGDIFLMWWTF